MPDGSDYSPELGPSSGNAVVGVVEKAAQPEKPSSDLAQDWLLAASNRYDSLYDEIVKRNTVPVETPYLSGDPDHDQPIIEEFGGLEDKLSEAEWSEEDRELAQFYSQSSEWYRYTADDISGGDPDPNIDIEKYAAAERTRQKKIKENAGNRNAVDPIVYQVTEVRPW